MHPICPFITEEIFQRLKQQFPELSLNPSVDFLTKDLLEMLSSIACISAPFPNYHKHFVSEPIEKDFATVCSALAEIRKIRAEMALAPPVMTDVYFSTSYLTPLLEKNKQIILSLVRIGKLSFVDKAPHFPFSSSSRVEDLEITIPLPAELKEREKGRLLKEIEKLQKQIEGNKTKLSMPQFIERAPESLVEQTKSKLQEDESLLREINHKLTTF
jgi:valyl-tRNA synthetase